MMRPPVVDYVKLRPSNIGSREYRHVLLLGGWLLYGGAYLLTENLIPAENCRAVHCALDDIIPFCEVFVVPYTFWYLLVAGSLLWFILYDIRQFTRLQTSLVLLQILAMMIYIAWPSRQDLRPEVFPRENVFSWVVGLIYAADTNTGVCPSMHVAFSLAIAAAWFGEPRAKLPFKLLIAFLAVLISLSTAFIKQHSTVDIFAAIPLWLLVELILYALRKRGIGERLFRYPEVLQ